MQKIASGEEANHARLAPDDETELWARRDSDASGAARASLVDRHLPLAKAIAANIYKRRIDDDVPFDDYLQHASLGLIEAIDRFDVDRGVSFSTYATYRIRGSVLNGLDSETERRHQQAFFRRLQRERSESLLSGDGEPKKSGLEELAALTVHLLLGVLLDEGDPTELGNDSGDGAPEPRALDELRLQLDRAMDSLPERDRIVLKYHYFYQVSFSELGDQFNLSKGRISQIHRQALVRLRSLLGKRNRLDDYF